MLQQKFIAAHRFYHRCGDLVVLDSSCLVVYSTSAEHMLSTSQPSCLSLVEWNPDRSLLTERITKKHAKHLKVPLQNLKEWAKSKRGASCVLRHGKRIKDIVGSDTWLPIMSRSVRKKNTP